MNSNLPINKAEKQTPKKTKNKQNKHRSHFSKMHYKTKV